MAEPAHHPVDCRWLARLAHYSVWAFGDTFLRNPNAEGETPISDSWAFTTDFSASTGIIGFQEREDSAGQPAMLLQLTQAEQAFNTAHEGSNCEQPCGARLALWPGAIVPDPARNRGLVFYQPCSLDGFARGNIRPYVIDRQNTLRNSASAD